MQHLIVEYREYIQYVADAKHMGPKSAYVGLHHQKQTNKYLT